MDRTIYALGFFDGVHIGHQELLRQCRALSQAGGVQSGVVTFRSHPDELVLGAAPRLLNTPRDREWLLKEKFHMEQVVTLPFDRAMQTMPWTDFLEMLRRDYAAVGFVCGDDFRFGAKGAGNAMLLADYCRRENLPWAVVAEQDLENVRVTSTLIRRTLENGDMDRAVRFLGHPHMLRGTVLHGKALGRTLGVPTANLALPDHLACPRFGVYSCRVWVDGKPYPAVTNVGIRPTVHGTGVNIESWLLDYTGDLYGKELTVEFHHFLRPERRFDDLDQLRQEILRNAQQTRDYFKESNPPA